MKKILPAMLAVLVWAGSALGQGNVRVYTCPVLPSRSELHRLNLSLAWTGRIPVESQRDGISDVYVNPLGDRIQVFTQTLSGRVNAYDGETGDLQWTIQIGEPYWASQPMVANSHSLLVVRRDQVYILDRKTGEHRLHEKAPSGTITHFGFRLPITPTAAPALDESTAFFVLGNRIVAYFIPDYPLLASGDPKLAFLPANARKVSELWSLGLERVFISQSPVSHGNQFSVATSAGDVISFNRFTRQFRRDFKSSGLVGATFGKYHRSIYVGCTDNMLYSIDMDSFDVNWRAVLGGALQGAVSVNDQDVFASAEGKGLFRVERKTGRVMWSNPDAERFLAVTGDLVLGRDRQGRLIVIDGIRGKSLACGEFSDWKFPVTNVWTDRAYLANHDGQIICLRHADRPTATKVRTPGELEIFDPEGRKIEKKGADGKDGEMKKDAMPDDPKVDDKQSLNVPTSPNRVGRTRVTILRQRGRMEQTLATASMAPTVRPSESNHVAALDVAEEMVPYRKLGASGR